MKATRIITTAIIAATCALSLPAAQAQQQGIGRAEIQRHDLDTPGQELVQVRVDFAPGATFARHRHPGTEIAYVLEGRVEYQINGQHPVKLEAGESLFIPAGSIHTARNASPGRAIELAIYLIEKGRPPLELVP
jgi:quercetin dioxygenase-like cupin family protein